ncbi:hypothetical protein [Crossiella sp. S99.1]|uniref:hypothetical protein n=1 Tax=Crossiella sp. S99.1 TaxID=2936271 RepID=UPI001FFF3715|nr:hypothetical protein [Crossiella sp. S99.1]MCK2252117.1 hypothetical protein [Crossiella sp. S99.1]
MRTEGTPTETGPVGGAAPGNGRTDAARADETLRPAETPQAAEAPRVDMRADWTIPATTPGWRGALSRAMGPGRTRAELLAELLGGGIAVGLLAILLVPWLWPTGPGPAAGWVRIVVLVVLAVDLVGGVLTNSTTAAKRWYHRDPRSGARVRFVALHLVHLVLFGLLVLDRDWVWALGNAVLLVLGTVLIEASPVPARRVVAMAAFLVAVLVNLVWLPVPVALVWVPVFFQLKLLVCHLVPEVPVG